MNDTDLPAGLGSGAILLGGNKPQPAPLSLVRSAKVEALPNDQDTDTIPTVETQPEPAEVGLRASPAPIPPPAPTPEPEPTPVPKRDPWPARVYESLSMARHRAWQRKHARTTSTTPGKPAGVKAASYRFKRGTIHIAYLMSLGMSGYGQTRFFATWLGIGLGLGDIWKAAIGAVFLELTMVGADAYSMYHRQHHPESGWMPIRIFAYIVMLFGAVLNFAHFGAENIGMGSMFAAATVFGFTLQDITGHLKVRVLLHEQNRLPERSKIGALRWVIYRGDAYRVWANLVADPNLSVDDEFRRVLAKSDKVDAHVPAKKEEPKPAPTEDSDDVDQVDEQPNEPRQQPPAAKRSASSKKNGKKKLEPETARKWADNNGAPGSRPEPSLIIKHFEGQGYEVPSARTIRRWFEDYDKQQAEAAAS